jgi:hypothetical protein
MRLHLRANFTSNSWYASMNWSSSGSVFSGQAAERHALPHLHIFGFNGLDVASNDEGSFALMHASRRPPPLASCSTGLPLAPLFPVAATVFGVSGRPTSHRGDAAREVVQDAVETAAARFQCDPVDVE